MSLAEAYQQVRNERSEGPFPLCRTCRWYRTQDDSDRVFFNTKVEMAREGSGSVERLRHACVAAGLQIARSSFHVHVSEHHDVLLEHLHAEKQGD